MIRLSSRKSNTINYKLMPKRDRFNGSFRREAQLLILVAKMNVLAWYLFRKYFTEAFSRNIFLCSNLPLMSMCATITFRHVIRKWLQNYEYNDAKFPLAKHDHPSCFRLYIIIFIERQDPKIRCYNLKQIPCFKLTTANWKN